MKLKLNLLINILDNVATTNKYSKSFLNLKNVIDLEKRNNYVFSDDSVYTKFKKLEKQFNSFLDKIPLIIIEKYFADNHEKQNKHVYLEFKGNELSDYKVIELYQELENYFQECFSLACLIADLYNFEVKFNEGKETKTSLV